MLLRREDGNNTACNSMLIKIDNSQEEIKQFTELMRQIEIPNNILKLLEGGIELVLSRGETFRGEKWQDKDNLAHSDDIIKALPEDASFREGAKEAFVQQMEIGWEALFMGRKSIG